MTEPSTPPESFQAFKNSFFYGARNDLNFKFLKNLSEEDAATFFQELLWKLGDSLNDGDLSRLIDHVYTWQRRGYAKVEGYQYDDAPFAPMTIPLASSRLALLSSSGQFVEGDDPKPFGVDGMTQEQAIARIEEFLKAAPVLSAIPFDTPAELVHARHGGYDVRGARMDPEVVLPRAPLVALRDEGKIGSLLPAAYSFVGATAQTRLLHQTGPEWVAMFKQQEVDAALLVPV